MNKYEQLIEHIINDETDKARELFHTIVVEKSRDIYESLIDEQDLEEVGGNQVEDLVDEVSIDEQGISEEEEGEEEDGDMDHDEMHGEEHEEAELEDRVVDLEDALDELKAEFDALMAGEEAEEHDHPGIHDMGGEDVEGEEEQSEFFEAKEEDEEDDEEEEDEEDLDESIVREYVEKVGDTGQKSESGKQAGADASIAVNKTTPVAGKNDMGGSAKNIATGKANPAPDGTSPAKAEASLYKKGQGQVKHAGSFENVPGAKAGQAFAKKEGAVKKEEGAVNKTTPVAK